MSQYGELCFSFYFVQPKVSNGLSKKINHKVIYISLWNH